FNVSVPPLPVQSRHFSHPDQLYPFLKFELSRLARPIAAIVDMQWFHADVRNDGPRTPSLQFGLHLVRQIRSIKPNLPVFVWSNVRDKRVLQSALQQGATYYFNKPVSLAHGHGDTQRVEDNQLQPGKLYFHAWEAEQGRYLPPARLGAPPEFITASSRDSNELRSR